MTTPWSIIPLQSCERLLMRVRELGALTSGDFALSSGGSTGYYFDGRLLSLDAVSAAIIGEAVSLVAGHLVASVIGGPAEGAIPIVGLTLGMQHDRHETLRHGFYIRKGEKDHGLQKLVEGHLQANDAVIVVDDTCSTGGSLLRVTDIVKTVGASVVVVFCLLDRDQGGKEAILEHGYPFVSMLKANEEGIIQVSGRIYYPESR